MFRKKPKTAEELLPLYENLPVAEREKFCERLTIKPGPKYEEAPRRPGPFIELKLGPIRKTCR